MFTKQEKIVIFTLAAIQFNHIVDFMIIMPLGPQLMRIFDITPQKFSLLVSIYTFMAGLSGFLASFYADRFDRKKNLIFMFVGFAVSTGLCGTADSYTTLMIFRSLAGFFGGVMGSLVLSIVSDVINYERRGSAMGAMTASFSVASIAGVPLSLFLANHFGWHAPFYFLVCSSFLVLIFVFKFIPPLDSHLQNKSSKDYLEPIKLILKNPTQLNALLFMFVLMLSHFAIIPFISPSLVANAGITEAQLPLIYLVGGICSILSAPLIGKLSDKKGKSVVFRISLLFSIIPIYLITNQNTAPAYIVLAIAGIFFISAGARMIPASTLVSGAADPKHRGSFMSILSCVQSMAMALGAWLAGQIIQKDAASGRLENYHIVGYLAIGIGLVSLFLLQKIKHLDVKKTNVIISNSKSMVK
jgi:MFS transporter, DHA1 family, inner membrane transport protein